MRSSKRKTDLGIFCTLFWTLLDLTELLTLAGSHLPPFSLKSQRRNEDAKAQLRRVIAAASGFQTRDPFAFIGPKKAKRPCFHWFSRLKRTVMLESPLRGNPREEAFCEGSDPKGGRSKGSCFFPKGTFAKSPRADADPLLIPQSGSMSKNEIPIGQSAR